MKSLKLIEVEAYLSIKDTKEFIRRTYVEKHVFRGQAVLHSFYIKRKDAEPIDLTLETLILQHSC